ncbi:TonB-dependent siderophore receptor [Microvirga arsenatis]|uniref:TonB-dependent siderophore receptor n=1 Tax=Microvirga arsenatis TaxID=2692265 RepID=A0ABW9Z5G4_9HYPH|nr:TonB-dependent siderophore receptor [Microvirga arsenatis]NBJ12581.1 TonB-dependent siderophore receptor [Microvirga arsenatis]NBJ26181.1 TonB-dependent siderophore receptor [Microvirga arsenatis]
MNYRHLLSIGVSVISLAVAVTSSNPSWAQTQQASGEIQLETVTVEGQAGTATGPVSGYVPNRTATGSKTSTPIEEIPQSISVIGREELEDRQVQKVDEALRYTAGVFAQPFGLDSDTDWFFIRGFYAGQTGVFLNNLPLYQYGFGGFYIDPFILERIEVLKGPAAALYGGSSIGGIVNLVSKRPTTEQLRYIETGINSWGNGYAAFDFGGVLDKDKIWSYRLTGKVSGGGWETEIAEDFRGVIAPAFTFRPNAGTELTVLASYQHMDLMHTGGFLPYVGTAVPAPYGRIPRRFYYNEPDVDLYRRDQAMIGYEFEHAVNDVWILRQNFRYAHTDSEERGPYPFGYQGGAPVGPDFPLFRVGFNHHTIVNTLSLDNQAEAKFGTGPLDHTLLLGLDYKYYNIDHIQAAGGGTPISPVNPIYGAPQGPTIPYLDQDLTMNQVGFYAQDQIRYGGWIATLNGRYDHVSTKSTDKVSAANFSDEAGEFSGRLGLGYEFANGMTPYVAVSRTFNPVIGSDFFGQSFAPETGQQYEVGLKYRPAFVDALITVSLFDLTRQNVNTSDPEHSFFEVQLGEVRSRGVEVEAQANITAGLKAIAAFTAYDIEITADSNPALIGNRPNVVPEVLASGWLDYTVQDGLFKGLGFGAGIRYVGFSYADNENTLKVPAATVFDAGIRYTRDNFTVALNVNNLFDNEYVSACDTQYTCNYGAGRVATLKASYKW